MSNEEIVCETVEEFLLKAGKIVGWNVSGKILPGDSVTFGGRTVVYRPPPPRDEAREAFEAWWNYDAIGISTVSQKECCLRAFLAGRASVEP